MIKNNSHVLIYSLELLVNCWTVTKPSTTEKEGHILTSPKLRVCTFAELKSATMNFKPDTILGEGGFRTVYKGWVDDKTFAPSKIGVGLMIAVKKLNPDSLQGLEEWQYEINFLGTLSHPNLVSLVGYYCEDNEFLLVYEYMAKGSLENHLFQKGAEPLSWDTRLKIAIGVARGLAFLHTSEKQVIYRYFKASNILLDRDFNAKVLDFGLAKNGPVASSHVATRVMGTFGYAAPEYVATGHLYVKSDVYGFGVVLLEMLSVLRAVDPTRPSGQRNRVVWLKPSLGKLRKLKEIMDPKFGEEYPIKGAVLAAKLTLNCLGPDFRKCPSMREVVEALEQIQAINEKPKTARKLS
ncbi:hypothetical protein Scep_030477 [Stephania cephalantha]|uniref:non-specific serine/threonine protein kinase n=1 Tax=Stephania cephalantha TaxID=152367 RepID=A0AAP0DZU6_9MAGN